MLTLNSTFFGKPTFAEERNIGRVVTRENFFKIEVLGLRKGKGALEVNALVIPGVGRWTIQINKRDVNVVRGKP